MGLPRTRAGVTQFIVDGGLMPNFATTDEAAAIGVAQAVLAGGCPVLEFLNRGDGAAATFECLAAWARTNAPDLLLGAGTITEAGTAARFINSGARFVVGPNFNPDVAVVCNRLGIPYVPGCGTATEMSDALAAGADIVKFFPAPFLGGPPAVKALLGPFPDMLVMPSGGVETSRESLEGWFAAGVAAVSVGGSLISAQILAERDWARLEEETARVIGIVRELKGRG